MQTSTLTSETDLYRGAKLAGRARGDGARYASLHARIHIYSAVSVCTQRVPVHTHGRARGDGARYANLASRRQMYTYICRYVDM